jgi:hypothetical protein
LSDVFLNQKKKRKDLPQIIACFGIIENTKEKKIDRIIIKL